MRTVRDKDAGPDIVVANDPEQAVFRKGVEPDHRAPLGSGFRAVCGDQSRLDRKGGVNVRRKLVHRAREPYAARLLPRDFRGPVIAPRRLPASEVEHVRLSRRGQVSRRLAILFIGLDVQRPAIAGFHDEQVIGDGRPGDGLVENHANDRKPRRSPGPEACINDPRAFGDERVFQWRGNRRSILGTQPRMHRQFVAGRRGKRLVVAQLTGERAGVDPAPLAGKRRLDLHGNLRCLPRHAPDGNHRPIELKHNLPAGRYVFPARADARNAQRLGAPILCRSQGRKTAPQYQQPCCTEAPPNHSARMHSPLPGFGQFLWLNSL